MSTAAAASWVDHTTLELWEDNPRDNDAAVPKVAESIKRFGFVAPVVLWPSKGMLVAGHTRLKAIRAILASDPTFVPPGAPGPGLVPVRQHEFANEAEARAYAIADNRLGYEADWDYSKLAPILASFNDVDQSLLGLTGFDQGELEALLKSQWAPDFVAPETTGTVRHHANDGGTGVDENTPALPPRSLSFDEERWAKIKATVQSLTGAGDTPEEIADGLFDLVMEMGE